MLEHVGRLVVRARRIVLALTAVAVVGFAVAGIGVIDRLSGGGFVDADAESTQATQLLDQDFGTGQPNFVLVVTSPSGSSVDDARVRQLGADLTGRLGRETGVLEATSYWTLGSPEALRSKDDRSALVLTRLAGDEDEVRDTARTLRERFDDQDGLTIQAAGSSVVYGELTDILQSDLIRAELFAFPLTLLLLLAIFGGLVAASLPLLIGLVSVTGTLAVLAIVASVTDVSVFALNLTSALGLGLAIDYGLFILSRFREELATGTEPHEAVRRTVSTAGRTVIYSAVTVSISLAVLLIFPLYFLTSFAYAGIAVVLLAAFAAVVVLPAALAVLGHRVNALAIPRFWRRGKAKPDRPNFWGRLAAMVMRRPIPFATVVVVVLLALGAPFLNARFGLPDDRVLPASAESRQANDVLREEFSTRETEPAFVVATEPVASAEVASYAEELSRIDGVARIDASTGSYAGGRQVAPPSPQSTQYGSSNGTWLSVVPDVETYSPDGERLVEDIRSTQAPAPVLVGGRSAELVDTRGAITDQLPLGLGLMAAAVGILLFLFTGSVLIPLKALLLNLLSLTATFGAMVWVFQEGHLRWLVGDFAVTGTLDITMPVLMFCVAFGLSMDYELFMLSRIREEWVAGADNVTAVTRGLERTGGLITGAALIVAVVFLSFVSSGVTFLKLLGLGLALAVLVDATIIRGVLVPAFMRLAGRANWWAPRPLRALHALIGLRESSKTPG
ncbi:MAG TPA: MMPL family transporter [Kribbella sp.]|uniref:MMPL family transporter n=1 Tax=Kribbella sp. TaxID=1871183 RepID=UPI002D782D94|nr:MMPL family transporter [Kribbella sp.]HET6298479.1 MMPL family transporter [Kribbella sp.]